MSGSSVELTGVVVNKRKLSKKLVFFDLESAEGSVTELCIKVGPNHTEAQVKDIRDDVKVGDTVILRGYADPGDPNIILISSIAVTSRWTDEHPGEHFVPRCAATTSHHSDSKTSQVCKFHINGGCQKGDDCPHLHVDLAAAPRVRQNWIAERKQARRQAAADQGDPHSGSTAKKSARAAVLAQWLVDTYGVAFLNSGTGVVDVAGGRGSLSFALQVQHGVTCTVVDPRLPKPTKEQLRYLQRPPGRAACPPDLAMQPILGQGWADRGRDLPEHIQAAFDEPFWSGPHAGRLKEASLIVGLHPDQATDSIVDYAVRTGKPFAVVPCCVFPRLFRHRRMPQFAVQTASQAENQDFAVQTVEDMHCKPEERSNSSLPSYGTDQQHETPEHSASPQHFPTSGLIEMGRPLPERQKLGECTDRSTVDQPLQQVDAGGGGGGVVTHEQLIIYLQHKGGLKACTARLPFDGMNTVVYRLL